jgi:hypothetical protein
VIRISNPLLASLGIIFWFTDTVIGSFMFGLCFGQIYVNYKRDKESYKNGE